MILLKERKLELEERELKLEKERLEFFKLKRESGFIEQIFIRNLFDTKIDKCNSDKKNRLFCF